MQDTQSGPVLVVGASGKVGSEVLRLLEVREITVRAASRTPLRQHSKFATTTWVELDLDRPASFESALRGVETVLLMARPGDERPEKSAFPFIEAMQRAHIRRVVNLTAMGCELRPEFGLRKVELAIEASAMGFTHLRPNFFMQIFCTGPHYAQISRLRQIRLPAADACISFIDARDVAAVATKCIMEPEHAGRAYTLTGAKSLSHADVTKIITDVCDSTVEYVPLSEAEARIEFSKVGLAPENVERLLGFYRIVQTGAASALSPAVRQPLGREPRGFADFANEYANVWNVQQKRSL